MVNEDFWRDRDTYTLEEAAYLIADIEIGSLNVSPKDRSNWSREELLAHNKDGKKFEAVQREIKEAFPDKFKNLGTHSNRSVQTLRAVRNKDRCFGSHDWRL